MNKNWLVIGISGVSCGGKTTLSNGLRKLYPGAVMLSQDDYFLPIDSDKHVLIPELNHFNWDILSAFDMEKMRSDVTNILNSKCDGEYPFLIIEGVLILNDIKLAKMFDKKYYLTLPYGTCLERRLKRTYNPPDVPGYFDKCVWPEYVKNKEEAFKMNSDIQCIDSLNSIQTIIDVVSTDIMKLHHDSLSNNCNGSNHGNH